MFGKWFSRGNGKKSSGGAMRVPREYEELLDMARKHNEALMQAHIGTWKMDEAERYDVDLAAGRIIWFFPDKQVTAPAQLLGTWNGADNSFLWGWDHPSAPEGTAVAARAVKDFADAHGIAELQERIQPCDFEQGWDLAAIAVLLGELQGAFRFQASETAWAYLGFGTVTMKAP